MANERKQYDNEMCFTLSENEDRGKEGANPNWPDYKGKIQINGVKYWLSGWLKEGPRGQFISGKAKIAEDKPQTGAVPSKPRGFPTRAPAQAASVQPKADVPDEDSPF
jgi:hypothetical protein